MRWSIRKAIEALLGLACLGLLLLLLVPWAPQALSLTAAPAAVLHAALPETPVVEVDLLPPQAVLTLFVPPPASSQGKTPPVPAPRSPEASWLRYLGYSSGADGASQWYIKDTRTGRIITLSIGAQSGGWSLVGVTEEQVVVKNGSDTYSVPRRAP